MNAHDLTKEDITFLESKAVDEIAAFLFENEHVATYVEALIEKAGIEIGEPATEQEMETYSQTQANLQIKLLAKVIGIL